MMGRNYGDGDEIVHEMGTNQPTNQPVNMNQPISVKTQLCCFYHLPVMHFLLGDLVRNVFPGRF